MTNEVMKSTKTTTQEMAKEVAKEIGKNIKLDVSLQGPSAAVFLSILSACTAGVLLYGIYTWGELQAPALNEATN